jgi:hypothetical protein
MIRRFRWEDCPETLGRVPVDEVKLIMRMLLWCSGPVLMSPEDGRRIQRKIDAIEYLHTSSVLNVGVKESLMLLQKHWSEATIETTKREENHCVCM